MDMSVKVGAAAGHRKTEKTEARAAARGPNSSDLDAWLEKVEALGELKRITAEVDPDLEAATITYLVGGEKSPALLFENIKGHPGHRALYNMIGCNLSRFCVMIGEQPVDHPLEAVQILQRKLGRKMPPREVSPAQAICNQNIVEGEDIDIRIFPAQRMWPLDGGMYLGTGDAVITKDPETGRVNVGTYRMMIKGPREVGVYTSPGKDATIDREKWWKMGKPMPIAAAYGIDPLLFLVAATSLPKTECEYDYYSGINGAPIEVFTSELTGLPLPARAEIVLEGFLYPDETFAEGPFGEFTGYYGRPSGATPYMRVERVRYRDNPTLTCALMADGAANEAGLFWAALRSAGIWADLQKLGVPGIEGVWSIPEAAGWGITVVSLKQMYAGHAPQVMALAAQCTAGAYFREIRDRRRRGCRSHQRPPGSLGNGDALATGPVDRHSARDLEHLSRSQPEPAGDPSVGIEVPDQCLHGLPLHQDLLQADQIVQGSLRQRRGEMAGAGVERQPARRLRVRG